MHGGKEVSKMLVARKEIRMHAGVVRNFWICDDIAADWERYNWRTGDYELIESRTSQRYFVDNLQGLSPADTVNLYINSMGGSVKEALGIYSVLQRCPAKVTAYIDGFAASAASVIAMAAEKVIMPRNTAMMIHNAAWWAYGNPAELRKSADDLDVINRAAIQSYSMHAGDRLPADKLQQMLDAETWLTAEDCVACGLADELGSGEVDIDTALEQFRASANAAANSPDAKLFQTPPAFLADRCPAAQAVQPTNNHAEQGTAPDTNSCIYMLLKSMTESKRR